MDNAGTAQAAEVAKPAPAATPPAAAAPDASATQATETAPTPERTFTQKELDEILEKRLGKERRKREDLDRRLKITEELALKRVEADKKAAEPAKAQPTGEPTREQFGTYEEFLEARAEYRAGAKVEQKFKEREEADRTARAQKDADTQREQFRKAMKDSAKDIDDFDEVLGGIKADDPVANVSASAIEAADAPGKVLYHLATNPDEAERIAGLSVGKQARAIVELEAKLAKPPVKPSRAPDPINPIAGKKSASADEMPDAAKEPEKWLKWRQRQIAERKRAGASA